MPKIERAETKPAKKALTEEEKKELRRKLQEKAMSAQQKINDDLKKETDLRKTKNLVEIEETDSDSDDEARLKIDESHTEEPSESFMDKLSKDIEKLDIEEKFPEPALAISSSKLTAQTFEEMLKEYEQSIDRDNNKYMQDLLKSSYDSKFMEGETKKRVKWSDQAEKEEEEEEEWDEEDENSDDYEYSDEEEKESEKVEPYKPTIIHIKHTKSELLDEIDRNRKVSREKPELDSPGDIFSVFYKPKSILKATSHEHLNKAELEMNVEEKQPEMAQKDEVKNAENEKFEPSKAFTGEIVEKPLMQLKDMTNKVETNEDNAPKKPVSRFKAAKKN